MDNIVNYDASLDAQMEERNHTEQLRDENNKICCYKFKIYVRDKAPLEGSFTREEMERIYRLYSSEGSGLTQRSVSREFPNYTLQEFKKILRAFSITKSGSVPLAPHTIEENSTDKLVELTLQHKENDYLKRLEQDRNRLTEKKLKDLLKDFTDLKHNVLDFKEFVKGLEFNIKPITPVKPDKSTPNTIVVYLSDMHVGCDVSPYSLYYNKYDKEEIEFRLKILFENIVKKAKLVNATTIVVCNLGDSLDGQNGETTRGGHLLPQNMNNKDQYKNYIQSMIQFFSDLSSCGQFSKIKFYSVDGGNHDGDFGYIANKSLELTLNFLNPSIDTMVSDKMIGYFTEGKHTFLICHGKDSEDMFKGMPLTINDRTENKINEYLDYEKITGTQNTIHFVKGDLHQSATTYAKRFRYKSTASFFGSSKWIHTNFGDTKAAVDYDVIIENEILEGRIPLN